jgi:mRNA interferase RelE/StbE
MNISYKPSFYRSLKTITDNSLKEEIEQVINYIKVAQTPKGIPELKKLRGYKKFYRIKIGDYRIGVTIDNNMVTLATCMHRRDIYKFFP